LASSRANDVLVATPDRLGEYILVDYVAHKRKWIG